MISDPGLSELGIVGALARTDTGAYVCLAAYHTGSADKGPPLHLGRPSGRVARTAHSPTPTLPRPEGRDGRVEWWLRTLKQACYQEYPEAQYAFKDLMIH